MESNINLKSKLVEFLQVLGKYDLIDSVRSVNFLTSYTKSSDFDRIIKGKNKSEEEIEDFLIQAHKDIAQLCAENILLWHRFLDLVIGKEPVRVYLSQLHHYERVKRFEEGFYITENPLRSAYTAKDYTPIVELLKKSLNYLPLPLECGELDGDAQTIPIVFEDQFISIEQQQTSLCPSSMTLQQHRSFQTFSSIAQFNPPAPQELMISCPSSNGTGAGGNECRGAGSKSKYSTLSKSGGDSGIGSTALSLADECSCGMAEILLKQQRLAAAVGAAGGAAAGQLLLNPLIALGNTEKMIQIGGGLVPGGATGTGSLRGRKKPPSHSKSLDLLQDNTRRQLQSGYDGHHAHGQHPFMKSATVVSSTSSTSSSCSSNKPGQSGGGEEVTAGEVVTKKSHISKSGKQRSVSGAGGVPTEVIEPITVTGKLVLGQIVKPTPQNSKDNNINGVVLSGGGYGGNVTTKAAGGNSTDNYEAALKVITNGNGKDLENLDKKDQILLVSSYDFLTQPSFFQHQKIICIYSMHMICSLVALLLSMWYRCYMASEHIIERTSGYRTIREA